MRLTRPPPPQVSIVENGDFNAFQQIWDSWIIDNNNNNLQGDYQTPSPADSAVHDLGNDSREESGHAQHVQHAQHAQHEGQQDQSPPSTLTERKTVKKEKPGKKDAVMKVKSFYEAQLKNFQQNAAKMEESLVNQIYQVKIFQRNDLVRIIFVIREIIHLMWEPTSHSSAGTDWS